MSKLGPINTARFNVALEAGKLLYEAYSGWMGALVDEPNLRGEWAEIEKQQKYAMQAGELIGSYLYNHPSEAKILTSVNYIDLFMYVYWGHKTHNNPELYSLGDKILDSGMMNMKIWPNPDNSKDKPK